MYMEIRSQFKLREMQNKTIWRNYFSAIRLATIQISQYAQVESSGLTALPHIAVGMENGSQWIKRN